jgi:peptidoglycan/LPS O-acetylase OafA/YrhL
VISYSLYVWHAPVLAALADVTARMPNPFSYPLLATTLTVVLVGVGAISYRCIERPFLRRKQLRTIGVPVMLLPR